jgi:transposase
MIEPRFLSPAQRAELVQIVRRPSEDHGVARRANAILLLDDGKSCAVIAEFLYLDDDTVRNWHKHYQSGGLDRLTTFDWKGGLTFLNTAQKTALCDWLNAHFIRDTRPIIAYIKAEFGVQYSHSGCLKLLHRMGFEYRKPKALPRVADEVAQQQFIDMYEKLLNTLPADEAIYFADAVHPEYQVRPAYGWMKCGSNTAVKTTAGRQRVNIHGAISLEDFDMPFVEVTKINGDSSVALLAKIEAQNPLKSTIHVIWDNAPYHKCKQVRAWLSRSNCRINLIRLPAYCPHLNPIERLWAVMHRHVTHNRLHTTQPQFANAILTFFRQTIPEKWRDFRDVVTDNFRVISHQNFRVLE